MIRSKTLTILVLLMFALSFGGKICCVVAGDYCACCAPDDAAIDHPASCDCEDCVPVDSEHPAQCDCENCVPNDKIAVKDCCRAQEHPAQCDCEDCVPVDSMQQNDPCSDCAGNDCSSPLAPCKAKEQCIVKTLAEPKDEAGFADSLTEIGMVICACVAPVAEFVQGVDACPHERSAVSSPVYLTLCSLLI